MKRLRKIIGAVVWWFRKLFGANSQHPHPASHFIEPHGKLLKQPTNHQLLYKVMKAEDLVQSFSEGYLHFTRIDKYSDFPGADKNDGAQPPNNKSLNKSATFEKMPSFSSSDYFDRVRSRTYACCFSTENTDFIWKEYGTGGDKGKACIVFDFGKLRQILNETIALSPQCKFQDRLCRQIFSINYGLIDYVDWQTHQVDRSNSILYTYTKDNRYSDEKELRISLSAFELGQFIMADGRLVDFSDNLRVRFDFKAAFKSGVITKIQFSNDCDPDFIQSELQELGICLTE